MTKTVLVVDDEATIRSALGFSLERERYSVLMSGNGSDGLECVKSSRPDLVILDLAMPRLSGFEFLERLRSDEETESIPVIVLTAYGFGENRRRCHALGAVSFVPKPFSPRSLVAEVGRVLGSDAA